MTSRFSDFTARLREFIVCSAQSDWATESSTKCQGGGTVGTRDAKSEPPRAGCYEDSFAELALELFALQFGHNAPYRRFCEARGASLEATFDWREIPAVPTVAFKELELTCLPPAERTAVFHSSGTTEQQPSRHFHNAGSLVIYEASLLPWFRTHVVPDLKSQISNLGLAILTPPPNTASHSSLVHMFETVRREFGSADSAFIGRAAGDGAWDVARDAALRILREACESEQPLVLVGTAFSFVHLLDFLGEQSLRFQLPAGSRVMETGGYKGRSRALPKAELHALITRRLGIPPSHIVCEYGMSELSSQAYDRVAGDEWPVPDDPKGFRHSPPGTRHFCFPPWARAQIISPETGREVAEGETGLIRVFDLVNVFSVMAIQTEDLGVRRGDGFELVGRAALAEPRGCSLMAV